MPMIGRYPTVRMRRNRAGAAVRALVAETVLTPSDLIWPIFIMDGANRAEPVPSMPGIERLTVDLAVAKAKSAEDLGISAVALFPYTDPAKRDSEGSEALNPDNLVCTAVRAIRRECPELMLICDVALDPYTDHGHDGLLREGRIVNDETLEVLVRQALLQAEAGCDTLAPSDMMDGRVGAIRDALDDADFTDTRILSYAAKYASAFYAPFRDAIGSSTTLQGDKRTYQMNPTNTDEALREVALDLAEGADMVMVKPGMPYLDIIQRVKAEFSVPTFAYHVSGEYSMLCAAFERGWLDRDRAILEAMHCFKRAGADAILTYFAPDVVSLLNNR